ncbi:MAG TPA: histidine kinase [Gemmatimonadales bacterium]|nr:histidine kinase [Gemmatimonadales bacterium]
MQVPIPTTSLAAPPEPAAAILQAAITAALAGLCALLYRRYRKPYLAWWTAAWALYLLRVGAILSFLASSDRVWLYWHQVVTGWTALAILGAALVFSRHLQWRRSYLVLVLFPPLWSYVAIYRLDEFLWAAGPAVLFLSLATLWTGWVFYGYRQRVGSRGAGLLAWAFLLWGLHHLDYPFLRAQGAWNPWGYYLDILFELAVGAGIVLLALDELQRGLAALSALSGDLQRGAGAGDGRAVLAALLDRPLTLPAVRGSALYLLPASDGATGGAGSVEGRFVGGAGVCAGWPETPPADGTAAAIRAAIGTGRPQAVTPGGGAGGEGGADDASPFAYVAALPIYRGAAVTGALVLVGQARDPFTALDDDFLVALGGQVGAALEQADLRRRLEERTAELERLSARTVEQHEAERRRLSRELHDETAQVFSAVKMELGVLRDVLPSADAARLDHTLELVDTGIRSIRRVVADLRPSLLDDLGLLAALRSLVAEFGERSGLDATLDAPATLPPLSKDAELALFRAVQEALANVARHAAAARVEVRVAAAADEVRLDVVDDGRGFPCADGGDTQALLAQLERAGHMGLAGMRERLAALGGTLRCEDARPGEEARRGVHLGIRVPVG